MSFDTSFNEINVNDFKLNKSRQLIIDKKKKKNLKKKIKKQLYVPDITEIADRESLFETGSITSNIQIPEINNGGSCQFNNTQSRVIEQIQNSLTTSTEEITNIPQLLRNITNVTEDILIDNQIRGVTTNNILNRDNRMFIDYPQLLCGNNPTRQTCFIRSTPYYQQSGWNCDC